MVARGICKGRVDLLNRISFPFPLYSIPSPLSLQLPSQVETIAGLGCVPLQVRDISQRCGGYAYEELSKVSPDPRFIAYTIVYILHHVFQVPRYTFEDDSVIGIG
ncbi:unnamed protein product [Malus baccata var. baccata]